MGDAMEIAVVLKIPGEVMENRPRLADGGVGEARAGRAGRYHQK